MHFYKRFSKINLQDKANSWAGLHITCTFPDNANKYAPYFCLQTLQLHILLKQQNHDKKKPTTAEKLKIIESNITELIRKWQSKPLNEMELHPKDATGE